jgi:hypothetical protein
MPDPQLVAQFINQTDLIGRTFVWDYQLQVSNLHFQSLSSRLGTTDILSDPAFVIQPRDTLQPAQLALQWNIINQTWPRIGSWVVSTMVQNGVQWTDGQGTAVTVEPGIDVSNIHLDWLHIQGGLQMTFTEGPDGGLRVQTQLPFATAVSLSGSF